MLRIPNFLTFFRRNRDDGIFRQIPLPVAGRLFTSPMPYGAYDRGNRLLRIYQNHQIEHVFILATENEIFRKARRDLREIYAKHGINWSQYAITDFQTPSLEVLEQLVFEALLVLNKRRVVVHCHAGVGRTAVGACGIVMAVNQCSADEAIEYVKQSMTVNMTSEQINLVRKFRIPRPVLEACLQHS